MKKTNLRDTNTHHQKRADDMGDSTRRYLIGIHTGGIGILATLAEKNGYSYSLSWMVAPLIFFVLGLTIVVGSIFLQKHKALKRINSMKKENFRNFFYWNWTWDLLALGMFAIGVGISLFFILHGSLN
ncbi:MAG: hypothetical protein SFW62_09025 [Alphaproteobacteria bacterium]|nr:hypothetical protein [Alphaproteobacteria bacterium]